MSIASAYALYAPWYSNHCFVWYYALLLFSFFSISAHVLTVRVRVRIGEVDLSLIRHAAWIIYTFRQRAKTRFHKYPLQPFRNYIKSLSLNNTIFISQFEKATKNKHSTAYRESKTMQASHVHLYHTHTHTHAQIHRSFLCAIFSILVIECGCCKLPSSRNIYGGLASTKFTIASLHQTARIESTVSWCLCCSHYFLCSLHSVAIVSRSPLLLFHFFWYRFYVGLTWIGFSLAGCLFDLAHYSTRQ